MDWFRFAASVAWIFALRGAIAADLGVHVGDAHGGGVADAVITVTPHSGEAAPPAPAPRTHVIDQKNETFIPYIEVFRPGDSVAFHNSDDTRHHAYSFAPARRFEVVLAPGESSMPLRLDKPGVIAVGCNIHDQMITYFYVSDAPYVARSGGDGHAYLSNLPQGDFDVRVWHPQLRPGATVDVQRLALVAATERKELAFSLSLLPDPRLPPDRERASY